MRFARWPEMKDSPLHSYEVRNRAGGFRWLQAASAARTNAFMQDLTGLMTQLPILVLACVVDRPGYNARYKERYGPARWELCRTAFTIAVERAAKFAQQDGRRLRVYTERSDKQTEKRLKGYYDAMRSVGAPFDAATSSRYRPLTAEALASTLIDFEVKTKSSRLMQIADMALWPACKGGYDTTDRAFIALKEAAKLLDAHCTEQNGLQGIKYSCFDARTIEPERQKPAEAGFWAATVLPGGDLVG